MAKLRTLKDLRESGQVLIAICHKVTCRHMRPVDLGKVIQAVGEMQSILPVRGQHHFSERMRCPACGHKGMFLWLETPKVPDPAFNSALNFRVIAFDRASGRPMTDVLRASDREVAQAGFEVAEAIHPRYRMEMSFHGQVIRASHLKAVKGGRG